jgi:hypothetical protein
MFPDFLLATLGRLIAGCLPQPLTVRRLGQAPRLATYCHRTKKNSSSPPAKNFWEHCATQLAVSCTVQRYGLQPG